MPGKLLEIKIFKSFERRMQEVQRKTESLTPCSFSWCGSFLLVLNAKTMPEKRKIRVQMTFTNF